MSTFDEVFGKGRGSKHERQDRPARDLIDADDREAGTIRVSRTAFRAVCSFDTLVEFHCNGSFELAEQIARALLDDPGRPVEISVRGEPPRSFHAIDADTLARQLALTQQDRAMAL